MSELKNLQPGAAREESFLVEEQHTAIQVGSGDSKVLATPWMIAFMERVSHRLLLEHLPQGASSVGVMVEVRHVAPSTVGGRIRVRVEVLKIEGSRVLFSVEAWDEQEQVGRGRHRRVIIDEARFLRRVEAKQRARLEGN
jgi:fluoroacetyl-CoA thioesterase